MSWEYRVMKRNGCLMIHEVYYNHQGLPKSWSMEAPAAFGESLEELQAVLRLMSDALKQPTLDYETGKAL